MKNLLFFIFFLSFKSLVAQDTLSIIGVGDMMLGTNFPKANLLPPNEGKNLFADVSDILQSADITFGNLEGVVLNEGGEQKKCKDSTMCYLFRMPEHLVDRLNDAGFDMLSIANNHVGDFGEEGRKNTIKTLQAKNLAFAGLLSCPTTVLEKNGIKYGLAAFAPNSGTVDIRKIAQAQEIVKNLSQKCDIVIVSFHGGAEGPDHQHVPKATEKYLGEDRGNVYEFAHKVIEAGADIVFGHGPHVTRAVEVYQNRFIAYSMGNFCTYRRFNLKGVNGIAPIFKVFVDKSGNFLQAKITATKQPHPGGAVLDKNKTVIGIIQNLSKTDFPENPIKIDADGWIRKK